MRTLGVQLVVFAFLVAAGLPRGFEPIRMGVDESWQAGLHEAFASSKRFGVEIVFTYGPWGFASAPLAYPPTMPWVVGYNALLKFALAGALVAAWSGVSRALFIGWLGFVAFLDVDVGLLAAGLWLVGSASQRRIACLWSAAVVGLLAAGKGTHLWIAVLAIVGSGIADLRLRQLPLASTVCVTTFLAAWLAASQRLGDLSAFVNSSWEIASGYSTAMAVWNVWDWMAFPFLVAALLVVRGMKPAFGWSAACIAVVLFLAILKIEFVRVGPDRAAVAMATLLAIGLGAAVVDPKAWNRSTKIGLASIVVAGFVLPPKFRWDGQVEAKLRRFDPLLTEWRSGLAPMAEREAWAKDNRDATLDLDFQPSGLIDVVPHHQSLAVANGWKYSPRVVFQSYQAYTQRLAERNAAHFAGPNAPDDVLVLIEPIDHRFAVTEDGLCWLEWFTRYRTNGMVGPFLRLSKLEQPKRLTKRLVSESRQRLGERWRLPANGLLWAEIDLEETLLQWLATLAYKSVRPTIVVDGGEPRELIPSLAAAGSLLSPSVDSTEGLRRWLDGEPLRPVESVVIDGPAPLYGKEYRVRLFEIVVD